MSSFYHSTSGRLMSTSVATALIGGGAAALMAQPTSLYVMALSSFMAVVGCIASLQLGIDEHPTPTIVSVILLPIFLFLYAIGLFFVMKYYPEGAYGILALGACAAFVAMRSFGGEGAASEKEDRGMPHGAHAAHH